jgi:hypothetical protein
MKTTAYSRRDFHPSNEVEKVEAGNKIPVGKKERSKCPLLLVLTMGIDG